MWNMGHTNQSYDDSVIQQLHMTSSEGLPSTLVQDDSFYTSQNLPPGHHGSSYAPYPTTSTAPGTSDRMSGIQSQPRAFYRVQSNPLYLPNDYNSSEPDLRSSGANSFMPSRAGSLDSSAQQSVTTDTGYTNQADAYGYMYSQNQGHAGGLVSSTPAPSPPTGPHGKKHKSVPRPRKGRHHPHHHQGFSPEGSSSPAATNATLATTASSSGPGGGKSKLRSASRTSKNTHHNPPATAEERRSRETHNNVEKQYRNRLNAHFENLLSALPESMQCGEGVEGGVGGVGGVSVSVGESLDSSDRRVSKAEVLDMARRHIKALERECAMLEGERDELRDNMEKLRWLFGRCEGGGAGSAEGSGFLEPGTIP